MNNLTKICKVCKVEQQRCGDFSGRSAVCCKCIYATKKAYFKTYYENNGDKMKTNEKAGYDKKHEGMRLKRLAKANIIEEEIPIPV